ncbi:hypothetical protein NNX28_12330 [Arthrobacter sp. zg-Y859]|uniref:Uncharacterized protein n=1 Tax=Arthrobacter jinronghuae TaxID=2964609 RepID=A0ABT1NSJ7_9MICC|nr:hypothetical protein [Arthrobacter jinronghuae]MCQ1950707.1 hypothetical protein [Arthrobacter jinronghuae]UWX80393.1 hypothetical protein N2K98_02920 [Arthrobacter jinronghuae]
MWPGIDPGFWADPSGPDSERLPGEMPQEITKMPEIIDIKPTPLPEVIPFEPLPDRAPGDFGGAGVTPEPLPVPREINGIPVAIPLVDQAPSDAEPNMTSRGRWGLT